MMEIILPALLCVLLLFVAYQDFYYRMIYWFLPVALLFIMLFRIMETGSMYPALVRLLLNMLLFALQYLMFIVYICIKERRFTTGVDTHIGTGDLLMIPFLAVSFSLLQFQLFLLASLLLSLLVFAVISFLRKEKITVPLAGLWALLFLVLQFCDVFKITPQQWNLI